MPNMTKNNMNLKHAIQMAIGNWILRNMDFVKPGKYKSTSQNSTFKRSRLTFCKKSAFLRNILHCPDIMNHPDFGNLPGGNVESAKYLAGSRLFKL